MKRVDASTSLRVEWSQPLGGARVNGYVVHYRDDNTGIEKSVPASSTTSDITDLTRDHSYTLKVEAISEHLSGVSESATVTVGKTVY